MASDAQTSANLRNATRSTGPISPRGKRASSANSRKHGLSSARAVVDPARAEEAAWRRARFIEEFRPATIEGLDAIEIMVAMTIRMEDCREALEALHVAEAEGAGDDWDHARKVEAEATAEGLPRRPGTAAARLAETKQGAELMLGRWDGLLRSLERGTWDESDRSAALDLLGVDRALRKPGQTALDPPEAADATAHVRAVIGRESARLRERLETVLARADARSRSRAGTPLGVMLSKPAALILRYEREAERRFHAALKVVSAARPKDDGLRRGTPPPPPPAGSRPPLHRARPFRAGTAAPTWIRPSALDPPPASASARRRARPRTPMPPPRSSRPTSTVAPDGPRPPDSAAPAAEPTARIEVARPRPGPLHAPAVH